MAQKLTPKEKAFVKEYPVDLCGTKAAIRAKYSAKSAARIAFSLLERPHIRLAIDEELRKRSERTEITADRVLRELAKIGFSDVRDLFTETGALRRIEDMGGDAAACVSSIEVVVHKSKDNSEEVERTAKIRLWDKQAALVNIGRHLGMFKDKIEITGRDGGPVETITTSMTAKEAADRYREELG
jgi:phage terminase small subunit